MDRMDPGRGAKPDEKPSVADHYVNSVGFTVSVYEFLLQFGLKGDQKTDAIPLVNVRMSPQHAKVMAKLFMRNVKAYEKEVGPIYLPQQLIQELHLEEEDKL